MWGNCTAPRSISVELGKCAVACHELPGVLCRATALAHRLHLEKEAGERAHAELRAAHAALRAQHSAACAAAASAEARLQRQLEEARQQADAARQAWEEQAAAALTQKVGGRVGGGEGASLRGPLQLARLCPQRQLRGHACV